MILTTHILSGAALGASVKNPYAVAGLAVVLHFLLDLLPHGDYLNKNSRLKDFWKVGVDLAIGFSIVSVMLLYRGLASTRDFQNIVIGIFFSLLPDSTTFLYVWIKMKFLRPIKDFHENLHKYENGSPKREFRLKHGLWDILISAIALLFLVSRF